LSQGERIINPLKKKRKKPAGTKWRGIMDPRIDRCKKHNLVDILLLCIIDLVCGVESVEDMVFFGKTHR
jgi:hypothetical protein